MEIRSLAVNALWIEQGHKVYVEDILMDQALLVVNYYGYAITLKLPPAPQ